ncbi:hypothetical protein [Streptomyces sp. NPDC052107]|uniref:hypothetical protein n=1 Tax=Streptomyces sp. NPDC052107 TaxID=3155632 RepID=UPI0034441D83
MRAWFLASTGGRPPVEIHLVAAGCGRTTVPCALAAAHRGVRICPPAAARNGSAACFWPDSPHPLPNP